MSALFHVQEACVSQNTFSGNQLSHILISSPLLPLPFLFTIIVDQIFLCASTLMDDVLLVLRHITPSISGWAFLSSSF